MQDFTHNAYKACLETIADAGYSTQTFNDYMLNGPDSDLVVLIRHDVDRRPSQALKMAEMEAARNIKASYYFRDKPHVFVPGIIQRIRNMNHEIGLHYESLSDADGDIEHAHKLFSESMNKLNALVKVKTVSMHGKPFSKWNNLDLLRDSRRRENIKKDFNLTGDIVFDLDYQNILYIGDTGRNWNSSKNNLRDFVDSGIDAEINNSSDLLNLFKSRKYKTICFQVHPERWTDNLPDYAYQWLFDASANMAKYLIKALR